MWQESNRTSSQIHLVGENHTKYGGSSLREKKEKPHTSYSSDKRKSEVSFQGWF